ncbi:MAG TPA: hypothetical protein VN666_21885 [Nitrospira sp.]|nr:hypothetical protein [Nitrospira sp.]
MAQGVGSTVNQGPFNNQDVFGGHLFGAVDYKGPTSYVQGGDSIDPKIFGFPNTILTLIGSCDHGNTYVTRPLPLQNGVTGWRLVWIVQSTGAEVAAAVNLSTFTVRLSAIGY